MHQKLAIQCTQTVGRWNRTQRLSAIPREAELTANALRTVGLPIRRSGDGQLDLRVGGARSPNALNASLTINSSLCHSNPLFRQFFRRF
jgi:hypothetical protein